MLGFFMPGSDTPWTPAGSAAVAWEDRGGQLGDCGGTEMGSKRFLRKKIHANVPGAKTFIVMMNFDSSLSPTYANTYNPGNSHIDLYGLDPYPCRTELNGCDYDMIPVTLAAAEAAGIPLGSVVPVYQAFGGGNWPDDGGGKYTLPTSSQEQQILSTWASLVPDPVFDYAYSWGTQNSDQALEASTDLQAVFSAHNK